MPNVRLLVLIVYVVATYLIQRHMLHHPLEPSRTFVDYLTRCIRIVLTLGVPLIGPLIAYFWVDFFPQPLVIVVLLALVLPLALVYLPWLRLMQVPKWTLFAIPVLMFTMITIGGILGWLLLFNEGRGITWALLPLLYFILIPPLFMLGILYYWAPELLPLSPEERQQSRRQAAQLLTGFLSTFPRPVITVEHGELQTRIPGNPFTGTGPGLLVTEPHNAVVLYQGTVAKKVVGPGVIFTGRAEIPRAVIDLQDQFRVNPNIEAQTRDNIRVRVPCSSIFHIRGSTKPTRPGEPWTYDAEAALQAYLAAEVDPAKQSSKLEAHHTINWADMPLNEAAYRVRHVVKRYPLDQLYAVTEPLPGNELPRVHIAREVREHVTAQMAAIGITVTGGGVGNRITPLDPAVVTQRLESWKASTMLKIEQHRGEAEAAEIIEESRVRSQALIELTQSLQQQLSALRGAPPEAARRLIALRLLQTLDDIARQPEVREHLSGTASETLTALQRRASQG
ncbi:MAG TPA: SPFH domain-containing protein [Anaerolineae bacterium]|nr:SPFH domain-containing protein [Anaerolineae bacterium]